jgi:predicted DNA-binding transcriptional regulator AlpA
MRLVDKKGLKSYVPFSSAHIARLEKEGKFPQRVKLTADGYRVAWLTDEVEQWIKDRAAQRTPLPSEE